MPSRHITLQYTFKIGAFLECPGPQYANRGECPHCKVPETMEHILIVCQIEGQRTLWDLAQELWEKRGLPWIPLTYVVVLGATLIQIKNTKGNVDRGATRLYRIMMMETVHMIWKIRSQQLIQRGNSDPTKWHTNEEVRNMWVDAMNWRLTMDHCQAGNWAGRKTRIRTEKRC